MKTFLCFLKLHFRKSIKFPVINVIFKDTYIPNKREGVASDNTVFPVDRAMRTARTFTKLTETCEMSIVSMGIIENSISLRYQFS